MKKSQGDGFGSPGKGLFSLLQVQNPGARIVILLLLFVLIAGAMVGLKFYAGTPDATKIADDVPAVSVRSVAAPDGTAGVPTLDRSVIAGVNDATPEEKRLWNADAMEFLLREARHNPAVQSYRRNLLPLTPGSGAQIAKDCDPWRLQFVRFRGPLEYMEEEDYDAVYAPADPPIGRVHRGCVRIGDGPDAIRVVFLLPIMPQWADPNDSSPTPEYKLITDGWVRGRGLVVKNMLDTRTGVERPAILVVATLLERDYDEVEVGGLEDIPFSIIDDDPTHADSENHRLVLAKEYPKTLYRLVKYAQARAGAAGAAQRKADGLRAASLKEAEYETVIGQPSRFRAKYYGGLGALAMVPNAYDAATIAPNDAGIDACINGWILTDERKLIQFVAPAALAGDWKERDRIRWEGFFYKTKLYPARDGVDRLAPLFVVTVLERVPPPKPDYVVQICIAGGFVLGVALLVFLVVREDGTKQRYRASRRRAPAPQP
jgi:hypothetical protein